MTAPVLLHRAGLDGFGRAVDRWHRGNWPRTDDPVGTILGVTKVAEEAGELVGALTKYVEAHRTKGTPEAVLSELGDVVIAAAGALRRVNDLLGTTYTFGEVVLARWEVVEARVYLHDEPRDPARPVRLVIVVGEQDAADAAAVRILDRLHAEHVEDPATRRLDAGALSLAGQEVRTVVVSSWDDTRELAGALVDPRDVYFLDPSPGDDVIRFIESRFRKATP